MSPAQAEATPQGSSGTDHRVALRGLSHRYRGRSGEVDALGPIDLEIRSGEFLTIVGPSGCGKSTLLSILAGFVHPTAGEVLVGDKPVREPGPERGVVFQQPNLYPWMNVRANVALGPRLNGVSKVERNAEADRLLKLVGLDEFADFPPYELSGGMQQRCQIARMLAGDPQIMLLDEPFGALDALTREQMQHELHRIWAGSGKTALFITHSVEEAVFLGTRVLVMTPRPGQIALDVASPLPEERTAELRTSPEFLAVREQVAGAVANQLL